MLLYYLLLSTYILLVVVSGKYLFAFKKKISVHLAILQIHETPYY